MKNSITIDKKKIRILITGGAGYIGSHTIKALIKNGNSDITVIDDLSTGLADRIPRGVKFIEGDFGDVLILQKIFKNKYDAVLHFAASKIAPESVKEPEKYYDNNVSKSIKFLDFCIKNGVKYFIFSSSAAVYGDVQGFPITENFETKPTSPYGWSKLMFEQILADSEHAHGIKYAALRYFNAGGADPEGELGNNHDKGEDIVSVLMRSAKNNTDFTIFGTDYETKDGTCVRDIIHVTDLAAAHVLALKYLEKGGASVTVNLGSEEGFTVKEISEKTKEITGADFNIVMGPRRVGDIVVSIASSEKAKKIFSWSTKHDLRNIVETAWDWEQNSSR